MPTYDYLCPNGHRFEVIHSVTGSGPEACPVCGASPVRKAFSAPSIHFKGSGWAKKDRSATATTKAARAAEGGATGSGSEGKPAGEGSAAGTESGAGAKAADKPAASKDSTSSGASSTGSAPAD